MKIAVVNDVPMIAETLAQAVRQHSSHSVYWVAHDGAEAVKRCTVQPPDLILMDLLMPHMSGVEAIRAIMDAVPCAILVVTASMRGNADLVYEAMASGALDAINTPTLQGAGGDEGLRNLIHKIDTIGRMVDRSRQQSVKTERPAPLAPLADACPLIAIGSSTGGPGVLARILGALPSTLPAAVTIVQHVDADFAEGLASWLDEQTLLEVKIAGEGERPQPGRVYMAGTGRHMIVDKHGRLRYREEPAEAIYRPSVDVMLHSAAKHWRHSLLGVLLTGMGRDGAAGLLALRQRGAYTIAQNRDSCAVYGMPKAAVELNAACDVLGVEQIPSALRRHLARQVSEGGNHKATGP